MKIALKIIFFILWKALLVASEDNDIFIIGNHYCITNSSSAIFFNEGKTLNYSQESLIYPRFGASSYSCTFDTKSDCHGDWFQNNWYTESSHTILQPEIIRDKRWESFTTYQTNYIENGYLMMREVLDLFENISIPISIKTMKEVHIYLCDGTGTNPSSSRCYWIQLGAHKRTKSLIWKCDIGQIPYKPKDPINCDNQFETHGDPFKDNTWSHFVIQKIGESIKVFQNNERMMMYRDENYFEPKKLFIRSRDVALWKIHSYRFLERREEGRIHKLGPALKPTNATICVSMFIKTSLNTNLTIQIKPPRGDELIKESFITNGIWQEIKLFKNNVIGNEYYMNFLQKGHYAAIDDVRECYEKEYRYIRADGDKLSCQKINDSATLTWDESMKPEIEGINCEANSFGRGCVPCELFGPILCKSMKYCQLFKDTTKCYCSAGFNGSRCDQPCNNGYFGHQCERLGHCTATYHPITGKCKLGICQENYSGLTCENVSIPFFKSPPVVDEIHENSFKISQIDMQYEGNGVSYRFQYAENDDKDELKWITIEPPIDLNTPKTVYVEDGKDGAVVKPDTIYIVRCKISSKQQTSREIVTFQPKTTNFTTACKQFTEEDIRITPSNTSATINLVRARANCKMNKYYFSVYKKTDHPQTYEMIYNNNFVLTNLIPYTDYQFLLIYKPSSQKDVIKTKPFTTEEGVPPKIQNLKTFEISPNGVKLNWNELSSRYGTILHYEIRYKVLRRLACSEDENNDYIAARTADTSYLLDDLKPFTRYEINVRGYTEAGPGEDCSRTIETSSSNLDSSEIQEIDITKIEYSKDEIKVYLRLPQCKDLSGRLFLKFDFDGDVLMPEKQFYGEILYTQIFPHIVIINDRLRPFTNYTVNLSFSRTNDSDWEGHISTTFQTAPDVPQPVSDFMVYSKTLNSVSIRWKPPYPPTGILEGYCVKYRYSKEYKSYFKPQKCEVWQEYHCATIEQLNKGYAYFIKIAAKNEHTDYGSFSEELTVTTKKDPSTLPYNLTYRWTDENDLYLTMYHPNNTNGRLRSFDIKNGQNTMNKRVNKYNLTYTYKIEWKFSACNTFLLNIRAHNEYLSSGYENIKILSPPSRPNISDFRSHVTNTTISLDIQIEADANSSPLVYISISPNDDIEDSKEIQMSLDGNNQGFKSSKSLYEGKNSSIHLDIGNNASLTHYPLEPGKNYSIAVFLVNSCNGLNRTNFLQRYVLTDGISKMNEESSTDNQKNDGLWALLLLLAVPLVIFSTWYFKKRQPGILKLVKPQTRPEDQIALTDNLTNNPPTKKPRVNLLKPKPSLVLPALTTKNSQKIRIIDFENYVKESIGNGELERQHNLFAKGLLRPHEIGSSPENKNKNRYKNLIAYDHTRVKLNRPAGSTESNYINANYIDGYKKPKTYIATQGPKSNTLNDFWIMIWQTNVKYIIMLANIYENGKKKVEKYWPDINENKKYGDISVQYISSTVFANFDERILTISYNGEERKITQLHFTTWPDHGIPLYSQSLVPFLQKMLKIPYSSQSPILIHCSAGVGRTGTIILCDICLRMAAGEGFIDFLAHLENLRNQRANLVDNIEQYKLAHLVVLECLFGMRTAIPCNEDMRTIIDSTISNNGMKTQMKYILETQWHDSAMETMLENEEVSPVYPEKNRFKDIVPEQYRVYITKYPYDDESSSSYINAVFVDGFRSPGRFIVTQQPMPNTQGDFWRMVWERSCTVIISLNTINLNDKTMCQVWPMKDEELQPVDFIKIVHKNTRKLEFYNIITVELLATLTEKNSMVVNIVSMNDWRSENLLPNSIEEFLTFMDAADALSRTSENVIVTCYDGAKASGLYVAMSFLIEKMKLEQQCDVCLAVRTVRHSRKQFITTEEQYEFLYRASLTFITGFQSYSNFS